MYMVGCVPVYEWMRMVAREVVLHSIPSHRFNPSHKITLGLITTTWCDSILLGQICNTKRFIYFSKNLVNIRVSDLSYSHDMKTQLESITKEVIQLCRANKEQQKSLNRVDNFLGHFCYGNGQQKSYTASNKTCKSNKTYVDIKSEYNDTYSVYVKPDVSSSKLFE